MASVTPFPVFAAPALAALQQPRRPQLQTTVGDDVDAVPVFSAVALAPYLGEPVACPAPVLVVEDDRDLRTVVYQALTAEGLRVETARDGEEALARIADQRPALVVLDLGLPRIHGSVVAAGVRAHYGDRVPLLVVSASPRTRPGYRCRPRPIWGHLTIGKISYAKETR